jgi:hypothetical protein
LTASNILTLKNSWTKMHTKILSFYVLQLKCQHVFVDIGYIFWPQKKGWNMYSGKSGVNAVNREGNTRFNLVSIKALYEWTSIMSKDS